MLKGVRFVGIHLWVIFQPILTDVCVRILSRTHTVFFIYFIVSAMPASSSTPGLRGHEKC